MLDYKITEIPENGLEINENLQASYINQALEEGIYTSQQPSMVHVSVQMLKDNILITGTVQTNVTATCVNCLEEQILTPSIDINLVLVPQNTQDQNNDDELIIDEENAGLDHYDPDLPIDIGALLLEQIAITLPLHPRCNEQCKGLCHTCGVNLNHEQCQCKPVLDPRWSGLENIQLER